MGTALKSASVAFLAAAEGTEQSELPGGVANPGGTWVDEQVVVCAAGPNTLVTSRRPQDLPSFCDTFIRVFGEAIG